MSAGCSALGIVGGLQLADGCLVVGARGARQRRHDDAVGERQRPELTGPNRSVVSANERTDICLFLWLLNLW